MPGLSEAASLEDCQGDRMRVGERTLVFGRTVRYSRLMIGVRTDGCADMYICAARTSSLICCILV